jgi:hypothetical protein
MKKVLSLVLALMMVVGMSTVAFAAATGELSGNATATADLGYVAPGQKITVTVDLTGATTGAPGTLEPTTGTAAAYFSAIAAEITAADKVVLKLTVDPAAALGNSLDGLNLVFEDATSDPNPNTLTVDLSGDIVIKTVPTGWKITGFNPAFDEWVPEGDDLSKANMSSYLPITADMFKWKDKNGNDVTNLVAAGVSPDASVRSSQLNNVGIRRVYQKNTANTIRDVELRTSDSDVRVRTVKFYTKTSDTDVELKVALTFKGSTKDAPEYSYSFTIENDEEIIEEGQTEAASYGNIYLKADATVRNVEFQGDEDEIVFATKTVVKGQKYYFNVDTDLSDTDKDIIENNPEVDSIYTVYQNNMANATVQFKNLDREFFVYDGNGKLLGTTKDKKLPLASKYILTTAKVDFGGEEEPVEEPVEEPTEPEAPPMGGGEVVETPNTYNPNTGL